MQVYDSAVLKAVLNTDTSSGRGSIRTQNDLYIKTGPSLEVRKIDISLRVG